MLHTLVYLLPALFVDGGLGLLPDTAEILHFLYATIIAERHLFVDGPAALGTIGPGHMMEPEQIALGAGVDVVVE